MGLLTKYGISEQDAINKAGTRTGLAYDNAAGSQQRQLSRMGVNPNSGRFAGLIQQQQYDKAAGTAGAMNDAAADWRNYMANLAGQDAQIEQANRSLDMRQQALDNEQNWQQKAYYDQKAEERAQYRQYQKDIANPDSMYNAQKNYYNAMANAMSGASGTNGTATGANKTTTTTKKTGLMSSSLWRGAKSLTANARKSKYYYY